MKSTNTVPTVAHLAGEPATNQWQLIIDQLRGFGGIDKHDIEQWLEPIAFVSYEEGRLKIAGASDFFTKWIGVHYQAVIEATAQKLLPDFVELQLVVDGNLPITKPHATLHAMPDQDKPRRENRAQPTSRRQRPNGLGKFVVGKSNQLAYAAAMEALNRPLGAECQIIDLYGDPGVGKTRLLKGLERKLRDNGKKVRLVSAEEFVNELLLAIKEKTTEAFRKKYRELDCLLVDEVDFLCGKTASLEEFLHTIRTLIDKDALIAVTANEPASKLALPESLRTTLSQGLTIRMGTPDKEMRLEIIREKAKAKGLALTEEVVAFIEGHVAGSIRSLEGIVANLALCARVEHCQPDLAATQQALAHAGIKMKIALNFDAIVEAVAKNFGIDKALVLGKQRERKASHPRQLAIFLCRDLLPGKSLTEIGNYFHRDHSTVLYAVEQIAKAIAEDLTLIQEIAGIKLLLGFER